MSFPQIVRSILKEKISQRTGMNQTPDLQSADIKTVWYW